MTALPQELTSPPAPNRPDSKLTVSVSYNGLTRSLITNPQQAVQALLAHALKSFEVQNNPHLLSLYFDGVELADAQSVADAGIHDGSQLLLRPGAVKGGARKPKRASRVGA